MRFIPIVAILIGPFIAPLIPLEVLTTGFLMAMLWYVVQANTTETP